MAGDGLHIVLRLALYLDMTTAFGVALFGTYALAHEQGSRPLLRRYRRFVGVTVAVGMGLSLWAMVLLAETLFGVPSYAELPNQAFDLLLTGTPMGIACCIRLLALLGCLLAASWNGKARASFATMALTSGSALATLAWTGHGAMHEGLTGGLHLFADIAHLAAAGAWIGALVAFLLLATARQATTPGAVAMLSQTSTGFAQVGTLIVTTLMLSGSLNYLLIVGPTLKPLVSTDYGRLLLAKLILFAGMLVLAAANRFRLSPALATSLTAGDHRQAVATLRQSLFAEVGLAVLVLAITAWLGILPPGTG